MSLAKKKVPIEYGYPQGTILGQILFSIYVNDLLNVHTTGQLYTFADDMIT